MVPYAYSGGWQTRVKLTALLLHEPICFSSTNQQTFLIYEHRYYWNTSSAISKKPVSSYRMIEAFSRPHVTARSILPAVKLTTYSGKIDSFLDQQKEHQEHLQRVNATTLAKKKQLERFINKNRAKASTASQARSKAKQLERLELEEWIRLRLLLQYAAPR